MQKKTTRISFSQWLRDWWGKVMEDKERSIQCIVLSSLMHLVLLLVLSLLILPASGRPDGDLIQVSFAAAVTSGSTQENGPEEESNPTEPHALDEEYIPTENVSENLTKIKESLTTQDPKLEQYLQERKQRIAQKQEQLNDMIRQQSGVRQGVAQRGQHGTLEPRTFYGVPVLARSMLFLLDISGSMNIADARKEMKNAYQALKPSEYFNLIAYAEEINVWQTQLMPATLENIQAANHWVDGLQAGGRTDIYGALEKAIQLGSGSPRAEIIYFLSDGLATSGVTQHPLQILAAIKQWNSEHKLVFYVIGFGQHQDKYFLGNLAEQNYGRYFIR